MPTFLERLESSGVLTDPEYTRAIGEAIATPPPAPSGPSRSADFWHALGMPSEEETIQQYQETDPSGRYSPITGGLEMIGDIMGIGEGAVEGTRPTAQTGFIPPTPTPVTGEKEEKTPEEINKLVVQLQELRARPLAAPSGEEAREYEMLAATERAAEAADYAMGAEQAGERWGDYQIKAEAQRLEVDKAQKSMGRHIEKFNTSIDERITRALNPNIPKEVANATAWIDDLKKAAADPTLPEEQREAALEQLADAQPKTGIEGVFGSWWRVLLGAVAMAFGSVGASLTGGTNQAANIIFKGIDIRIKEKMAKQKRLWQIGGLKTTAIRAEMDVTKSEYDMILQEQVFELRMADTAIQHIYARTGAAAKQHAVAALSNELQAKIKRAEMQIGMSRSISDRDFDLQTIKAEAQIGARGVPAGAGVQNLPYGTRYLPDAPPLSEKISGNISTMLEQYGRAKAELANLITLREDMPLTSYSGYGPYARKMNDSFGLMIDHVRKMFGWGAKFERTEAEVLIKAYLGSADDPTDWGYMLDAMKAFRGGLDRYVKEGLETGYGLEYTGGGGRNPTVQTQPR